MNRNTSLDILRGLASFSIMWYHFTIWVNDGSLQSSSTFLGRIGIYGVAIFYVLSGFTMYLVYQKKEVNITFLNSFFVKRIFRIYPLYWIACIASIVLFKLKPNFLDLFLNFTGLFGVFNSNSLTTGGWSIGNELVFYLFFPIFLWLIAKNKNLFYLTTFIGLLITAYFGFFLLNEKIEMAPQWKTYTNPLNQIFFFISGILIGMHIAKLQYFFKNQIIIISIFVGLFFLFLYYPTYGSQVSVISGSNRLVFAFLSVAISLFFILIDTKYFYFLEKPLSLLGEVSYSVYLIHPICYFSVKVISKLFFELSRYQLFAVSILSTLIFSYLIYFWIEKPIINLGKTVAGNINFIK